MPRNSTPPAVRDAAEKLVATLLAQPDVIALVSAAEIQRQVNSGALIPLSRLQMGPGLELAPIGRIAALEEAITQALSVLDDDVIGAQNQMNGAHALLRDVLVAPPATSSAPTGSNLVVDATSESSPDIQPAEPKVEEQSAENKKPPPAADRPSNGKGLPKTPDGRPVDMPAPDETRHCEAEGCGKEVTAEEGQMSFVRFRKVLCRSHFVSFKAVSVPGVIAK